MKRKLKKLILLPGIFLSAMITTNILFAAEEKDNRIKPKVYPYSYPYDEHPCPTGKCSRANENKKSKKKARYRLKPADDD